MTNFEVKWRNGGVLQRLMAVKGDVYYISVHFKQCFFYILMFPLGLYLKVY